MAPAHPLCQQKGNCHAPESQTRGHHREPALAFSPAGRGQRIQPVRQLCRLAAHRRRRPPNQVDFHYWRKRWKKKQAPDFWPEFYAEHFKNTHWVDELLAPATVAAAVLRVTIPEKVCWLQEVYKEQKYVLETF